MAHLAGVSEHQLAEQIQELSCGLISAFWSQQLHDTEFFDIMSPDLYAEFDGFPPVFSAAAHVAWLYEARRRHPGWTVRILNSTATVDPEYHVGVAWLTLAISGLPMDGFKNVVRESVCKMRWRRLEGGKWVLVEQLNVRGPGIQKCF